MRYITLLILLVGFTNCKTAKAPATATTLENTQWRLLEMNGMPVVTPSGKKDVHIVLKEEGKKLSGFGGCNNLGGSYTRKGAEIQFIVIATKMMCNETMELENFLIKALSETDSYKIADNSLTLFNGDTQLITFNASDPE